MYEHILYEVNDPVGTITLNRPDRLNALNDSMLQELRHALAAAENDRRVVGIVLTGAGRGFCAGMDMQNLENSASGERRPRSASSLEADPGDPDLGPDFQVTFSYLLSIRKPLIAAINGPCAGLGFSIALLCDLRFVSERARFTTSYSQRGLIAEHGTSWILPRVLGPSRALDLLWSARKVDAVEAQSLGLANRVFEHENLLSETRAYVESLAKSASPSSLRIMKHQVYRHLMLPLGEAMRDSNQLMAQSLERADFREGVASFVEKRPPRFARIGD